MRPIKNIAERSHALVKWTILCLVMVLSDQTFASKLMVLDNPHENYVFRDEFIDLFYDLDNSYSIQEIADPSFQHFKINQWGVPHLSTGTSSSVWIRFQVVNRSPSPESWYIELFDFNIDQFEIYIPDGKGGFDVKKGGDLYPFSQKKVKHKNFVFDIPAPADVPQTYYIKCRSGKSIAAYGVIRQGGQLISYSNQEYYLLALFYGIAIAMAIYNFFLLITIRDQAYLYYVLYIISMGFYALSHDGIGFQYVWPDMPVLNDYASDISLFSLTVWALMYGKSFLNLALLLPGHNRVIMWVMMARSILFLLILSRVIPAGTDLIYFDMGCFAYLYVLGLISWINGFKAARYYVLAFTVMFLGFYITSLERLGIVGNNVWTVYAVNLGSVTEMLFLSMALADRVKVLMKEKDTAQMKVIEQFRVNEELKDQINHELEKKVAERTHEINQMVSELESKNEELSQANLRLKLLNDRVSVLNSVLAKDNEKLATDILEISKSRVLLQDVKLDEFRKVFPDEEACLKYLSEQKWKDGFKCRKCGYTKVTKSKFPQGRRCKNCNYDESATSDTLFHNLKFPITKAFYMIYLVSLKDTKVTLQELSEMLDLRKETCWRFRKKILAARENLRKEEMDGWGAIAMISITN